MSVLDDIIVKHCLISKNHPDSIGEILRSWAFKKEYGCYSCFDLIDEFEKVEVTPREFKLLWGRDYDPNHKDDYWGFDEKNAFEEIEWFKHPNGIEVGWHWDGDGLLGFYVPELEDEYYDGSITNSDCKKNYGWEFGEK